MSKFEITFHMASGLAHLYPHEGAAKATKAQVSEHWTRMVESKTQSFLYLEFGRVGMALRKTMIEGVSVDDAS